VLLCGYTSICVAGSRLGRLLFVNQFHGASGLMQYLSALPIVMAGYHFLTFFIFSVI
jgi:hypothetical protein